MFFGCSSYIREIVLCMVMRKIIFFRKDKLSPREAEPRGQIPEKKYLQCKRRTFFFASLKGSLTVEAAVALPLFFFTMVTVIQLCNVMDTAARLGSALCETSEEIAISAYATEYGEGDSVLPGAVSVIYGRNAVLRRAGDTGGVKNINFLLSSFLEESEMVHLVMTYQMKLPAAGIPIPGIYFLQRGSVRGWTGRSGSSGEEGTDENDASGQAVYVTEHGTVYHKDLECSHIRLSIHQVFRDSLKQLRNSSGGKYHACERCGKQGGAEVFITEDGDRYHSSLGCSGLKRTIREISLKEAGGLRPCSKCGAQK